MINTEIIINDIFEALKPTKECATCPVVEGIMDNNRESRIKFARIADNIAKTGKPEDIVYNLIHCFFDIYGMAYFRGKRDAQVEELKKLHEKT